MNAILEDPFREDPLAFPDLIADFGFLFELLLAVHFAPPFDILYNA